MDELNRPLVFTNSKIKTVIRQHLKPTESFLHFAVTYQYDGPMSYTELKFHAAPEEFIWTVISTVGLFLIRLSSGILGINILTNVFGTVQFYLVQSKRKGQVLLGSLRQSSDGRAVVVKYQLHGLAFGFVAEPLKAMLADRYTRRFMQGCVCGTCEALDGGRTWEDKRSWSSLNTWEQTWMKSTHTPLKCLSEISHSGYQNAV